jgi:hypothetical protein
MTYKPPSKRKAKNNNSSSATASTSAAAAAAEADKKSAEATRADLVDTPRAEPIARALLCLLREVPSSSLLFSLPFFTLLTHLLHSTGPAGVALKQRLTERGGVLQLVVARFHAELSLLEAEERSVDFISHAQAMSAAVPLSSASAHADVHRHHGLYGLSMLLSSLLSDASVLASFASLPSLSSQVMSFFLRIRGLMLAHSVWLDKCSANLSSAVRQLFNSSGSDEEKRNTLRAYVFALGGLMSEEPQRVPVAAEEGVSMMDTDAPVVASSSSSSTSAPLTPHISLYILEQLCSLIKPPQLERQCLVTFKKSQSQEEYIRGSMKRQPYLSSSFLPASSTGGGGSSAASGSGVAAGAAPVVLMRHVKDAICTQLKLPNEDNMIELLVAGKIVGLDVPLLKMYTKWYVEQHGGDSSNKPQGGSVSIAGTSSSFARTNGGVLLVQASPSMSPHSAHGGDEDEGDEADDVDDDDLLGGGSQACPTVLLAGEVPMQITYRLTGLDGEATEEKVDSIPDDQKQGDEDPEVEFALAGALGEQGLRVLLRRLDEALPDAKALREDVEVRLVGLLIKLLGYAGNVRAIRTRMLQLQSPTEAHKDTGSAPAVPYCFSVLVEKLILTLEALIAAESGPSSSASSSSAAASSVVRSSAALSSSPPSPLLSLCMAMVNVLAALLHEYANQPGRSFANFAEDLRASASASVSTGTRKLEFSRQQLRTLLECAAKPAIRSHSDLHHRLLSLVALLTFGEAPLLGELHAHFARGLDLVSFDAIGHPCTEVDDIEALVSLVDEFSRGCNETEKGTGAAATTASSSFVPSPLGTAIRDYFFHSTDLVQQCFTYLQQAASGDRKDGVASSLPVPVPSGKKKRARESDDIENSPSTLVARPALPFVLRLLTSFSYGHAPTQALAASKSSALRILQQLEGMASTSRVGPLAESLLQALMVNNPLDRRWRNCTDSRTKQRNIGEAPPLRRIDNGV